MGRSTLTSLPGGTVGWRVLGGISGGRGPSWEARPVRVGDLDHASERGVAGQDVEPHRHARPGGVSKSSSSRSPTTFPSGSEARA